MTGEISPGAATTTWTCRLRAMHPFMSVALNTVDVPPEMRDRALKQTADLIRKIDEVRRQLELPVDQLPVVIEIYDKNVAALIAEEERKKIAERTTRLPMTMRSEDKEYRPMKIKAGDPVDVVVRPQTIAYRVENLAIQGDPSRWLVHDIKVGNRSQLVSKHGPLRGTDLGVGGVLENMKLESLQTAMDFTLVVQYVGPEPDGEVFEAAIVGMSSDF
jgi:hypothetical protein